MQEKKEGKIKERNEEQKKYLDIELNIMKAQRREKEVAITRRHFLWKIQAIA